MRDLEEYASVGLDAIMVTLSYPRLDWEKIKEVEVHLSDVRAADGIRIGYDYERNGWVIKQSTLNAEKDDYIWQEVAFVQAWALQPDA